MEVTRRTFAKGLGLASLLVLSGCFAATDKSGASTATTMEETSPTVRELTEATPIPTAYLEPSSTPGSVERLDYDVSTYDGTGTVSAYCNVYLPNGYDAADRSTRYGIVYLTHGMGGHPEDFLGGDDTFKTVLDNLVARGDMAPTIVVSATYYQGDNWDDVGTTRGFAESGLTGGLIPAVEGTYHTYATSTDAAGLAASRDHRAVGGFSLGAVATWFALMDDLSPVAHFLPVSCDCWAVTKWGGREAPEETAQVLAEAVEASGFSVTDYDIRLATCTGEHPERWIYPQLEAMATYPEVFVRDDTGTTGNFSVTVTEGGQHGTERSYYHFYLLLPQVFPSA